MTLNGLQIDCKKLLTIIIVENETLNKLNKDGQDAKRKRSALFVLLKPKIIPQQIRNPFTFWMIPNIFD
jgi:hypothetical protein